MPLMDLGPAPTTAKKKEGLVDLGLAPTPIMEAVKSFEEKPQLTAGKPPSLFEKIKDKLGFGYKSVMPGEKPAGYYREEQPLRTLAKAVPYFATEAIPFVPKAGEKVAEVTGFKPTPGEKRAAKAGKFATEIAVTGAAVSPLVAKLPARMALKTILASGLIFAGRKGGEEFVQKITAGKPVDWEGIHFEGGIGVLFGAGELGISKLIGFMKGFKALPKNQARPARAEVNKALKHYRATGDRTQWDAVREKYIGLKPEAAKKYQPPPTVKDFGKYPIVKAKPSIKIEPEPIKIAPELPTTTEPRPEGIKVPPEAAEGEILKPDLTPPKTSLEKGMVQQMEEMGKPKLIDLGEAKGIKRGGRPLKTLGGMPEKPPGLTKAEVEHLGRREATALRAGQKLGYPIGYKMGARWEIDKARSKLFEIRMAKAFEEKNQKEAVGIVQSYVPKEKQGAYIKRVLAAKKPDRIAKLTEAIDKYLDRAERRKTKREFTTFVKNLRKKYRAGEVKFGKLRNDVRDRVVEVLDKYDLSKLSEEKRQVLEKRDDYVRRVAGSVANAYESLEEDAVDILQMPNARTEELKRLSKTAIGSLDVDQIKYVQASLDHLVKIAERKGSIKERIRAEKIGKLTNQARQEIKSKTKEKGIVVEKPGAVNLVRRIGGTAQANIRTLVQMSTGKDNAATKELIVESLERGHKKKLEKAKEFVLGARDEFDKRGIDKGVTKTLDKTVKITLGGKTFNIDLDNLLSVYLHIKAEGNLRRLLTTGGLDLVTYERDPKLLNTIKRKNTIYTGRVNLKELRNIVEIAEEKYPSLKKMAEATFATNNKYQKPAINEISMKFQNYETARQEKYWPVHRVMPQKIGGVSTDISSAIEDQGRYLPRTGGRQRIRIIPWRQEFIASLQSNAAFYGMAMPMQDIRALVGSSKWQNLMKKSGRGNEMNALITMLRRMQGHMTDQSFIDRAGAQLLNRFGKSVLSLRISGYGVQTASIPAAWEVIEPKYFHKLRALGKLPKVPVKAVKEMMDLSPTLWMRWTARQFDFVTGGVAAQHSFDTLIHESSPLTDKMLNQYKWGDQKAIYQIYAAAQEKVAAETNLKRGTAEFKKKAIEITERALDTQPQWDMLYRSQFTSHPSIWFKPLSMFMSARNAQYNVLLRAIDDYKKGRISSGEAGKRISGVIYANVLVAGVKAVVKLGVKYGWLLFLLLLGDEEDKEKAVKAAKTEAKKTAKRLPIDALMNVMSLPVLGAVVQNLTYETIRAFKQKHTAREVQNIRTGYIFADIALDMTGVSQNTAKLGKHLLEGSRFKSGPDKGKPKWTRDAKRIADGLAELIAVFKGLPYSAPKGEIYYQAKSAKKAVISKKDGKRKKRMERERRMLRK